MDASFPPPASWSRRDVLRAGAVLGAGIGAGRLPRSRTAGARLSGGLLAGARGAGGAKGLGPGGSLLPPGSRPFPHAPAGTDMIPQIEHIVVLMMENHSYDDHLGALGRGDGLTFGRDGKAVNYNPDPAGGYVRSFPLPDTSASYPRVSQSWDTSHRCWDGGTNMGFAAACGAAAMGYYTPQQLPFYHGLASTFPIGDRYFCSVMGQTYPNRRFLMAGTALGDVSTNFSGVSGKDAPHGTIFDRLDRYGISWKNYYPDIPSCGLFLPVFLAGYSHGKVVQDVNHFLADARAGNLPAFSLVDPYTNYSEESGDVSVGEAFAARVIEAVLSSPKWSKTALVWTYDEHGGFFDHVPPQPAVKPDDVPPEIHVPPDEPGGYDYTGFRVPCAVVSAWAKRDHVSHVVYDHTSILKLLETKWNLPALTYRDANANNMLDFFDFGAKVPPFAEPPALPQPLNPFVRALPSTSSGKDAKAFHPLPDAVPSTAVPPPAYRSAAPPADAAALIAAHTQAALGLGPRRPPAAGENGSGTAAVIGGTAGGVVLAGAAAAGLVLRRRVRRAGAAASEPPSPA